MKDQKIKTLVSMAFFTAVTFLGIQAFRIPVPAVVGTPFIHFGHVFVGGCFSREEKKARSQGRLVC